MTDSMMSSSDIKRMEKQAYRMVGTHSAVKTCGWTKKMLKGEGGCYKLKFYGIMSHQCMQMTTSMSCANRCSFCWRDYKAPVSKEWKWEVNEPAFILAESLKAHDKLLQGFKGNDKTSRAVYDQSKIPKHVALSLTGEPIIYPKINGLLKLFNEKGISTFLVTNAQYWEQIRDLEPVTQLYLSIDAPNKEILKEVDVPLFSDYWERMNNSLDELKKKTDRTCIRLTIVKGVNDKEPENYAKLIKKGDPDFIEVKGYMFVGASMDRLKKENMPWHEEVVSFSKEINNFLDNYEIVSEHVPSRVVFLAKKKFKIDNEWRTWIDFKKWDELINSKNDFSTMDYIKKTPQIGLSGRNTKSEVEAKKLKELKTKENELLAKEKGIFVNEDEDELDFWKENVDDESKDSDRGDGC
ncbi:4-demethylwyosine synthase TYW1 [Candidatus Woesearchaeota archaeon]|nr:4-demethylwyosine synthase TYW1 [Candidatus Woesearchaeota archaeon]MCF7900994.1 4-demethylwyosine synthase TYW1 [Candidatus Woesearchaeota archaeon]MCF8013290.1 4-demethylwyosine synthase TYW1 [Candidatus Woesearchaeota archaeon]